MNRERVTKSFERTAEKMRKNIEINRVDPLK